jgi:putative transposase
MKREDKIVFIRVKLVEGWKDIDIRKELDLSERTYFRWKKAILHGGCASVANKRKPGPKPSFPVDAVNARRIQAWRKSYGWGPTKIEGHLDRHYGIHIPHNRIYQLIREKGLNNPVGTPRKTWGKKRWERMHSMSLWQGDWKDTNSDEMKPMMTFYDDRSRFVVASKRFEHATMENTIKLAGKAFRRYGRPEQILTDNGTQFTCTRSEKPTEFEQFCIDNGVETILSTKNRPTTTGKIENFHGCYDNEIWVTKGDHGKFVRYWNHKRPNGAIGYLFPVEVFYRDRKTAINSG